jgi:hypothetical protein
MTTDHEGLLGELEGEVFGYEESFSNMDYEDDD